MPETYSPILLAKKAKNIRETTGDIKFYAPHEKADCSLRGILRRTILRPVEMMLTEPILSLIVIYLSIICGMLYSLLETFPIIWQDIRGFKSHETSMIFLGLGFGAVLGGFLQLYFARPMKNLMPKWNGHPPCEMNLYGAMFAGPFFVGGILWLGWTGAYALIPWWVPALSTVMLGMSYAASALAASMIYCWSCSSTFHTTDVYWTGDTMGLHTCNVFLSFFFFYMPIIG
ncbi:hypothetical protein PTTG_07887 [Puccinia triticina 1-1 BBBD Race 1]|uniref:Major facilitator superfamily (MFS) profile domain-containing protein n=2 Tax=Puccinia triticina TaxID=208348 RepID=A0A180GF07_PUCT1|nr:uncharacterized protein PtA15_16A185 [Puccinia triticina]OAV91119.1 hypothetical protein PTTG_07887 [Puccinia triticina 1-1 BBBD Race 1]WAQ92279.1 hypothetical protein PtA15_16A185 [Puccinia triticina]